MDGVERAVRRITSNDRFARMVGTEIEEVSPGYARVRLKIEDKHLNSVDITHGAAVFTVVDMAFALASNSHGQVSLALNMSINFLKATGHGNVLIAEAKEDKLTNRTGLYRITVHDETGELVSVAEGLVYRKKEQI
ncbi:MAG: phenylacetic acid degradation protein [Firmicutes bacterium HGW-Firmicutes-14]|nr:MAG: phenylacetic acid degradation protein [Firmicutes bacterium HGW-Firmicutes-14]